MVSIGIDVSKGKSTVCFLKLHGEVLNKPFEVEHTESSLSHLINSISLIQEDVRVVMEATGIYHLPILDYLKSNNIFVSVVNPLIMHKYASLSIRRGKTDPLDAIKIANFGLDNWFKLTNYSPNEEIYDELRLLNRHYHNYITLRVKAKQTLTTLLDRTMPGIKTLLLNNSIAPDRDKLCDFVRKYWHFDNITKMSENTFIKSYNSWAKKKGYQASESKAKKIYALASDGIPTLASSLPSTKMLLEEAVESLYHIDTTLANILSQMKQLASTLKEYDVVMAMPGVGEILGPRIISEIGDATRFHSAKALIYDSVILDNNKTVHVLLDKKGLLNLLQMQVSNIILSHQKSKLINYILYLLLNTVIFSCFYRECANHSSPKNSKSIYVDLLFIYTYINYCQFITLVI